MYVAVTMDNDDNVAVDLLFRLLKKQKNKKKQKTKLNSHKKKRRKKKIAQHCRSLFKMLLSDYKR